jgi:cell division protein FtsZ
MDNEVPKSSQRGNRASMREGPLANLFRRTETEGLEPRPARPETPEPEATPAVGAPPAGPPVAHQAPEASPHGGPVPAQRTSPPAQAPRRAPSPQDRLRQAFSVDLPDNIMAAPGRARARAGSGAAPAAEYPEYGRAAAQVGVPQLRVLGVGGAGVNAVNRMIEAEVNGVEFLAINTDVQSLAQSDAHVKLQIGADSMRGLGAGSDPDRGALAARETATASRRSCAERTWCSSPRARAAEPGTGAAPVVARIARELGALTGRHRHQAVRLRGLAAPRAGRARHRGARRGGRHADRRAEQPAAVRPRQADLDGRGLPRRRRRPAPGRAGHLGPDHAPG